MHSLFLFVCIFIQCFEEVSSWQDGILFTTPNYPNPYTGQLSQRKSISVNSTQGVAVVFEQFLASAQDCVIACPTSDGQCSSLCGDAMDHGLLPKILRVPGNAVITMVSIDKNDGFPHSGISAKILPYDLQKNSFFSCSDKIDISSGETFYMISQSYPLTPTTSFSQCSIHFSTSGIRQGIRFAVYDFFIAAHQDSFEISGNSRRVEISGFATEDEPVVYYFQNAADVTFSINTTAHSFYERRFFILVKSYELPSSLNSDTCVGNVGHHDMTLGQQINFGTHLFGSTSYGNNLNCAYNFTRNGSNNNSSMFALAIQYESEKCCDTLTIEGLGKYEQIYQGFQSSNLFFTFNEHLSFLLQSDPVVGGTGVNATVEHIDCSCPPSQLLVKNGLLTSPGYSTSLSYCPGIYCYPDIAFQDDLYDLQLVVEDIDLRTYTIYNTTDYVEIVNSYNHQIVQMLPGYVGFDKFWATVSPVTVNFWANYASAIPMNMAGRGFSINLNLVKKDYAKEKVVFNDNNFLKDISKLDLASGKTFEFIVEARKGKQIYIYFFTKIATQVFVDIFDGDSMDAKRIDNKALYSNIQENGDSYFLRTSGEKAVIHIRGNPEFLQPGTDFQAMITDVDVDSCGPLVHSLKSENSYSGVKLQGTNCYKILHFSDSSYSQTAFMNIWISKSIDITVYLGLNTSMPIAQYASDTLPQYLFTNYLVLKYSTTDMVSLHYNWGISSGIVARTMEANETVIIMSADYGKANSSPLVQQFSVQLEGESNVQTGLSVQFLDSSGKGSSDITWLKYNDKITEKSLPPFQKTQNFASCGNKLLVDYTSPGGGSDNGLHLKITQADLRCSASSMVLVLPHLPIMLIILLKFSSILF